MAIGIIMYLTQWDRPSILAKYDIDFGKITDPVKVEQKPGQSLGAGCFHETEKGFAAVYGRDGNLYFQINEKKWNIMNESMKCSRTDGHPTTFRIEDENSSFEITYNHWREDALMSDLDDDDVDHDFFAYLIWLLETGAEDAAKRWSENN